jgi:hypothetical protein
MFLVRRMGELATAKRKTLPELVVHAGLIFTRPSFLVHGVLVLTFALRESYSTLANSLRT